MKKSSNASTSRVERFMRAWKRVETGDTEMHQQLENALEEYERAVISEEWDGDIPFALENPDSGFGSRLDFGGEDYNY